MNEGGVDVLDHVPEFLLGQERVEDFRVDVAISGCEVAYDHPVTFDADDSGSLVFGRSKWYMWIEMGETGVRGAPGEFFCYVVVIILR